MRRRSFLKRAALAVCAAVVPVRAVPCDRDGKPIVNSRGEPFDPVPDFNNGWMTANEIRRLEGLPEVKRQRKR